MHNSQTNQNTTTGTPAATVPRQDTRSGLEIAREQFAGSTFRLPGTETPKATTPTDAEVMATLSNEALTLRAMLMLGGMSAADANARAIASDRSKMTGKELARTQWAGANEAEKAVNAANQAKWDEALRARNEKARAIEQARQENNFHGLNLAPVLYTPIQSPAAITAPAPATDSEPSAAVPMSPDDALQLLCKLGRERNTGSSTQAVKAAVPTDAEVMATLSDEALILRAQLISGGMSHGDANARAAASDMRKPMTEEQALVMLSNLRRAQHAQAALRNQPQQPAAGSADVPEFSRTPAAETMTPTEALVALSKLRQDQNTQPSPKAAAPARPPVTAPKLTDEEKLAAVAVAMVEEPGPWLGNATTPKAIKAAASAYLSAEAPGLSRQDRDTVAEHLGEEQGDALRKNMAAFRLSSAAPARKPAKGTPAAAPASSAAPTASGTAPASTGILGWLERKMKLNRFTTGTR